MSQEIQDILRKQPIFSALEDSDIADLVATSDMLSVPMGKTIFEEGEPGDAAYLIYSGKVRVLKNGDGRQITLATMTRNDLFGELSIIADEPRMATVRAAEDTVLIRFGREEFRKFYDAHPNLQSYFDRISQHRSLVNFLRQDTVFQSVPPTCCNPVTSP